MRVDLKVHVGEILWMHFFVTQLAHSLSSVGTLVARFPISFGRRASFLAPVLLGVFPAYELALGMRRSRRKDFGLEALVCRCECFGFKYAGKVLKSAAFQLQM